MVTEEMYINFLRCLSDVVRMKRHEKWRTNSWFLFHEKAPAHRLVLIKDFSSKSDVTAAPQQTPYLLTCIQLICTCSLDWRQHGRDSAFEMLLISWRMRWRSWNVFTERLWRMFQTPLQSRAELFGCIRRLFWRKCRLNNDNVLYFSEIKYFQELFETTKYKGNILISLGDVVKWLRCELYDRGATAIFFSITIRKALQPNRSAI